MNEEAPREKKQGSPAVNYRIFIRFSNEKIYSFCWTFQTADRQNYSTCWQWSMHTAYMCVEEVLNIREIKIKTKIPMLSEVYTLQIKFI